MRKWAINGDFFYNINNFQGRYRKCFSINDWYNAETSDFDS